MTSADPVLVVRELTKRYGDFTALDSVSFSVDRGQILGLIGPNGAGKTTAIKILVGLSRPTSGSAQIAGVDCSRDSKTIKRLVGYMPDRVGAFDNMHVREYLDFFGAAYGIGRRKRVMRIAEVLETTNAAYMQDLYVDTLSHSMQQRIDQAGAIVENRLGNDGNIQASAAEAMVRFRTTKLEQELGGLLTEHVAADVGVTQFRELQTNLEDAFLSVTQSVAANNEASGEQPHKVHGTQQVAAS